MKCLGFKYKVRKKAVMWTGMKSPAHLNIASIFFHFFICECRANFWIQIEANESA
jgi:hypothetical protein